MSWNRESTQRIFTRMSRSTWACELKCHIEFTDEKLLKSHAPRERVSWNLDILAMKSVYSVTLHVSVWVEIVSVSIVVISESGHAPRERVSWNTKCIARLTRERSHAPRERVSWNNPSINDIRNYQSHAPRERVSWNDDKTNKKNCNNVTLHVSVWVEICENYLR